MLSYSLNNNTYGLTADEAIIHDDIYINGHEFGVHNRLVTVEKAHGSNSEAINTINNNINTLDEAINSNIYDITQLTTTVWSNFNITHLEIDNAEARVNSTTNAITTRINGLETEIDNNTAAIVDLTAMDITNQNLIQSVDDFLQQVNITVNGNSNRIDFNDADIAEIKNYTIPDINTLIGDNVT